jgi:hypothetical protein
VNENKKVEIDHAFDRPLSFRRKVALPHCGGMAFQEIRPSIGMVAGIGTKAGFDQDVLYRLSRDPMATSAHRLDDFCVSPAGLLADSDDRIGNVLVDPIRATFSCRVNHSQKREKQQLWLTAKR